MEDRLDPSKYTIAWIAPLAIEAEAAVGMLDEKHKGQFDSERGDDYHYIGGRIHNHNVVIVTLPKGQIYGTAAAAALATQIKSRFTRLWFALLVGVAAGLPNLTPSDPERYRDIRLGDVLVAVPDKAHTGVLHYSLGRDIDGDFQVVGRTAEPPKRLTATFGYMQLQYQRPYKHGNLLANYVQDFQASRLAQGKKRIECLSQKDDVYYSTNAAEDEKACLVNRTARSEFERTEVFYGCIGSGDTLMRNSRRRDQLRDQHNLIGLEMEAAGVVNILPCGVIRGVSDYGDGYKTKEWQSYAAMVAAAYAKGVLRVTSLAQENVEEGQLWGVFNDRRPNSVNQQTAGRLIDSLSFEHIEDRYNNIKDAHFSTCRWLIQNEKYKSWLDPDQVLVHHGILWLKGNPGSGKSTLIKFAFSEAPLTSRTDIQVSFFFNARGSPLEKSTLGLYRSLLFQLFLQLPQPERVFDNVNLLDLPRGPRYAWTIPQLKRFLGRVISAFGTQRLWIFVDALDECDETEVRDMISFFSFLGHQAIISDRSLRIFFASRYYPRITMRKNVELRLEDEHEHFNDVELYVQNELTLGHHPSSTRLQEIQAEVVRRSSGIFIWVVLVIQLLNIEYDHGRIASLEKKLKEIPDDLNELFEGILNRDSQNLKSMHLCIQWILFARHPLTRTELYFAVLTGTHPEEVGSQDSHEVTEDIMDAFILSCSKGLVELTQGSNPTAQFIHESVRDFLLGENGIRYVHGGPVVSLRGVAHDNLKHCCVNYLLNAQHYLSKMYGHHPNFQFMFYAASHILYHSDAAEFNNVSQEDFLRTFKAQCWPLWKQWAQDRVYAERTSCSHEVSLLYLLAVLQLESLIKVELRTDPYIDIEAGCHSSILRVAFDQQKYIAIGALLSADNDREKVDCQAPTYESPSKTEIDDLLTLYLVMGKQQSSTESLRQLFFRWGMESELLTLLRSRRIDLNANISAVLPYSPLCFAARRGLVALTEFLLNEEEVDCNARDDVGLTPLARAVREGYLTTVLPILQCSKKVEINAQCSEGRSPLSYATQKGREDITKLLLLQPDVDVNLRDKKGRTPLFHAAQSGHENVIAILSGVENIDILSRDNFGHTALSYAALQGHEGVVRQLLATGAVDINSRDRIHGRTALSFAVEHGHEAVARLLLNTPGIDIGTCDKRGRSLLDYAHRSGHSQLTHLLEQFHADALSHSEPQETDVDMSRSHARDFPD